MDAPVPEGPQWRSLRNRAVPWTEAPVRELAEAWFSTMPQSVRKLMCSPRWNGGDIVILRQAGCPTVADVQCECRKAEETVEDCSGHREWILYVIRAALRVPQHQHHQLRLPYLVVGQITVFVNELAD